MDIYSIMVIFYFIGYYLKKIVMEINNIEIDIIILSILLVIMMIEHNIIYIS